MNVNLKKTVQLILIFNLVGLAVSILAFLSTRQILEVVNVIIFSGVIVFLISYLQQGNFDSKSTSTLSFSTLPKVAIITSIVLGLIEISLVLLFPTFDALLEVVIVGLVFTGVWALILYTKRATIRPKERM